VRLPACVEVLLVRVAISQPAGGQDLERLPMDVEADERLSGIAFELRDQIVPLEGARRIGDELITVDKPPTQYRPDSLGDVWVVVGLGHSVPLSVVVSVGERVEPAQTTIRTRSRRPSAVGRRDAADSGGVVAHSVLLSSVRTSCAGVNLARGRTTWASDERHETPARDSVSA
jgi:hypothetical protein